MAQQPASPGAASILKILSVSEGWGPRSATTGVFA